MAPHDPPFDVLRIGDAERERIRDVLQRHTADGRLTLDELSDRLGEVYAAHTAVDLDHALRDLPPLPGPAAPRPRADRGGLANLVMLAALLIGIWAVAAAFTGGWYFWPMWPLLAFGIKGVKGLRAGQGGLGWGSCGSRPAHRPQGRRDEQAAFLL